MEVSELEGRQGPCISCLYEEEIDISDLCAGCNPPDPELREALINLLKPTKEAQPQGNK